MTIDTSKGPVNLLAESAQDGKTLILDSVSVYGQGGTVPSGAIMKEVLQARAQLYEAARSLGFDKLRLIYQRVPTSSSANPGKNVDILVDLSKKIV